MNTAAVRAFRPVDGEEAAHFGKDPLERAGLVAACRFDDVAVHRIARPHDFPPFALHGADELRQMRLDLVMAIAGDERQPPRLVRRIEDVDHAQQCVRLQDRSAFHADRIADAARSEERRGGKESGSTCDMTWWTEDLRKNDKKET